MKLQGESVGVWFKVWRRRDGALPSSNERPTEQQVRVRVCGTGSLLVFTRKICESSPWVSFIVLLQQQVGDSPEKFAFTTDECRVGRLPCMTSVLEKPWCRFTETFRFYLYPDYNSSRSTQFETDLVLYDMLSAHPMRTLQVDRACVLIPTLDTLCVANWCRDSPKASE